VSFPRLFTFIILLIILFPVEPVPFSEIIPNELSEIDIFEPEPAVTV